MALACLAFQGRGCGLALSLTCRSVESHPHTPAGVWAQYPKSLIHLPATWFVRCQNAAAYIVAVLAAMAEISPGWWALATALSRVRPYGVQG